MGRQSLQQANILFEEAPETRAIVAGLSLPMLIESYASPSHGQGSRYRQSHYSNGQKDGVKFALKPYNLKKRQQWLRCFPAAPQMHSRNSLGDGKGIKFVLARIDTALTWPSYRSWFKATRKPNRIIVVSDTVAQDDLRKS